MASFFKPERVGSDREREKKKSSRSNQFLPDPECRIPKIFAKKNSIN